jgi:hypothetical protein
MSRRQRSAPIVAPLIATALTDAHRNDAGGRLAGAPHASLPQQA